MRWSFPKWLILNQLLFQAKYPTYGHKWWEVLAQGSNCAKMHVSCLLQSLCLRRLTWPSKSHKLLFAKEMCSFVPSDAYLQVCHPCKRRVLAKESLQCWALVLGFFARAIPAHNTTWNRYVRIKVHHYEIRNETARKLKRKIQSVMPRPTPCAHD